MMGHAVYSRKHNPWVIDPHNEYFTAGLGCMWYIAQLWDYSIFAVIPLALMSLVQLSGLDSPDVDKAVDVLMILLFYGVSTCIAFAVEVVIKGIMLEQDTLSQSLVTLSNPKIFITYIVLLALISAPSPSPTQQ